MLPVHEALRRKKNPLMIVTTCSCALQSDVLMQYLQHIQNYHYFTVPREPPKKARVMRSKKEMRARRRSWSNARWRRRRSRMQHYDSINWGLSCKWPESCNYLPQKGSIMNITPVTHTYTRLNYFFIFPVIDCKWEFLVDCMLWIAALYVILRIFTQYLAHIIQALLFLLLSPFIPPARAHTRWNRWWH